GRQHLRRGAAEQDAIAVGLRMRHVARADDAAATAAVVANDGAENGLHPLSPEPADDVMHAGWDGWDHEPDRAAWIGLLRKGRPKLRYLCRQAELQNVAPPHGLSPIADGCAMMQAQRLESKQCR